MRTCARSETSHSRTAAWAHLAGYLHRVRDHLRDQQFGAVGQTGQSPFPQHVPGVEAGAWHRAGKRAEFEEAPERPLVGRAVFLMGRERRYPYRSFSRAGTGIAVSQRGPCPGAVPA